MYDITVVHELYRVTDLPRDASYSFLPENALLLQAIVDVAPAAKFQHQVKVILISEEGVKLHNIGVIKVTLYLDFPDQLSDELHLSFEDTLWDFFDSTDEVRSLMPKLRSHYRLR